MTVRSCTNGCGHDFRPIRAWHEFCSYECRRQHWIRTQVVPDGRITRSTRVRRPSRDGRGTRIYVTPEDFTEDGRIGLSLIRKASRARDRLEAA